jgi:hypothetical protein
VTQEQSNVCLAWLLYSINASLNIHIINGKSTITKRNSSFPRGQKLTTESHCKRSTKRLAIQPDYFFHQLIKTKYNWKSKHTFDERKSTISAKK